MLCISAEMTSNKHINYSHRRKETLSRIDLLLQPTLTNVSCEKNKLRPNNGIIAQLRYQNARK